MKTKIKSILWAALVALLALPFASCTNALSSLQERYDDLEGRVGHLETLCARMQTNMDAATPLLQALSDNEYITSVVPVKEGSTIIGYTINFYKSGPITLYNGTDALTPDITIRKDSDGIYYWVLNGEWLVDASGNKIPARGITPKLKVQDGIWYISYDEGCTWEQIGGDAGSVLIQNIEQDALHVTFVLSDGTKITLPKGGLFVIPDEYVVIAEDSYMNLKLDFTGDMDAYVVDAYVVGYPSDFENSYSGPHDKYYVHPAFINQSADHYLNVYIETPVDMPSHFDVQINLIEKESRSIVQSETIKFEKIVADGEMAQVFVGKEEEVVAFSVNTNAQNLTYELYPSEAYTWIKKSDSQQPGTRGVLQDESVSLLFSANESRMPRMAKVSLKKDGATLREFAVMQCGRDINMNFEDAEVKRICVENYDKDANGEISYEEAFFSGTIRKYDSPFKESSIVSFKEFKYFGSLANRTQLFDNCSSLESVELSEFTTDKIAFAAFRNCSSLRSITIPSSVTEINNYAFENSGLETIEIPMSIQSFGTGCFKGCTHLTYFNIEKQYDSYRNRKEFKLDRIPDSMFEGCISLKKIDGTMRVNEIGNKAFKDADLSEDEPTIYTDSYGDYAFYGTKLKAVHIYGSHVGAHAFGNCNELEKVWAHSYDSRDISKIPHLGADTFKRDGGLIDNLVIHDEGLLYKFEEQGWLQYFKQVSLSQFVDVTIIIND